MSVEKELPPPSSATRREARGRILAGPAASTKGLDSSLCTVTWPKNETRSESARKSETDES